MNGPQFGSLVCLAALCLSLAVPPASAAEVYKWIDEKGVTHYTEAAPERRKSVAIPLDPPPPAEAAPAKPLRQQEVELLERQVQRQRQEAAEKRARNDKAAQATRCEAAQERLKRLQTARRIFRKDAQGESVVMSNDERLAAAEEAVRQIEKLCKP